MDVLVGLSGGVDSAVSALLLQQQGIDVACLFMKNWEGDGGDCRAEEDRKDALQVAAKLGLPFHTANFSQAYWDSVFAHFLAEYRAGRTPNPDILCNREIKFRSFLDHARALGARQIATGHYARRTLRDGRWQLLRGLDAGKDQSYFLHAMGQEALASTLFPIGELPKSEVRRIAAAEALPVHAKRDSTGICFIGERDFRSFLAQYLPAREGDVCDPNGQIIARHPGVFFFTLGQREGLHIGGVRGRADAPWYVVGKDVAHNVLYVDQGHDSPFLQSRCLTTATVDWISGSAPASSFRCSAKTRYRQQDAGCQVEIDSASGCLQVRFDEDQRAVTPGQSVVLYAGEVCLGGAVIETIDAPALGRAEAA